MTDDSTAGDEMVLGAIKDGVGNAIDAAGEVVSRAGLDQVGIGGLLTDGLLGRVGDAFEAVGVDLGPIDHVLDEAMDVLTAGSAGSLLNEGLDALGLPDWIGDIGGGVLDFCTGNMAGAAANGLDALEDVARACGGDEVDGFLEVGSRVHGMFAGNFGVGERADALLQTAADSAEMLDQMTAVAAASSDQKVFEAGSGLVDLAGGGLGALSTEFGPLSSDTREASSAVVAQAKRMLSAVEEAVADGRVDAADIDQMTVIGRHGDDTPRAPHTAELADAVAEYVSAAASPRPATPEMPAPMLGVTAEFVDGVFEVVGARIGPDHEDAPAIEAKRQMIGGLLATSLADARAADALADMLGEAASTQIDLDIAHHHASSLRG